MTNGLHGKNLAQSETLRSCLRGTWEVSSMPGLVCVNPNDGCASGDERD
jgi:hypothetical protein